MDVGHIYMLPGTHENLKYNEEAREEIREEMFPIMECICSPIF
jgi:hypothetical protein